MEELTRNIGVLEGADAQALAALPAKTVHYLTSVFQSRHPNLDQHTSRELRTLAEAIDSLVKGNLPHVGDLLMQRFKSLEMQANHGTDAMAKGLEVINTSAAGLTSLEEQNLAAARELAELKLTPSRKKLKSGN